MFYTLDELRGKEDRTGLEELILFFMNDCDFDTLQVEDDGEVVFSSNTEPFSAEEFKPQTRTWCLYKIIEKFIHESEEGDTMTLKKASKSDCEGCYSNVYNHGCGGAKECWMFPSAYLIRRREFHIDDPLEHARRKPYKRLPQCYSRQRHAYDDHEVDREKLNNL